jgi:hypothetical protein
MANKRTDATCKVKADVKLTFRDRGLSSTLGLMVSCSVVPAIAHEATMTPVTVPTPSTHSSSITGASTHSSSIIGAASGTYTFSHTSSHTSVPSTSNNGSSGQAGGTYNTANHSGGHSNSGNTGSSGSTSGSGNTNTAGSHSGSNNSGSGNSNSGSNHSSSGNSGSNQSNSSSSGNNQSNSSSSGASGSSNSGSAGTNNHSSTNSNLSGTATGSNSSSGHGHHSNSSSSSSTSTPQALNLQSGAATYTLGTLGNFKTVTIDVGGKVEQVSSTTKLTSAELLAADQELNSAGQTQGLTINSQGIATGGSFTVTGQTLHTLDASTGGVSSLTIPAKVTLDDDVKVLNITGALTNYGSIDALSSSPAGNTIQAQNIINELGGTISGTGALTLNATQSISNAGTIKSSGDLNINSISLQNSAPTGTATILAGNDLNISAPTVNNAGNIQAGHDLNFTSPQSISVTQTQNANLIAGNNVNFRDSSYTGAGTLNIVGGNLLSQQLNVYAPSGNFNLNVGNVTGELNGDVGAIHSNTEAGSLQLGNLNINGDPTFYNQGDVVIAGSVQDSNGVPIALVASGNIVSDGGSLITGGGDLTLVAGVNFSTNDGSSVSAYGANWATVLTLYGPTAAGGFIDLTGNGGGTAPITAISTAATAAGNGGNITMVAYAGTGFGSGTIATPSNVTMNTNGIDYSAKVLSLNGNVQLIANGSSYGTAINIGNITADSAGGGGGVISLLTGTPVIAGTTIGGVSNPYQIVNGQPYGSFSAAAASGGGNINFGTITGYQATYNTTEVGGSFLASTLGAITNSGNIVDGGISINTGANFTQNTNWTAGGILVNTGGSFVQTKNSSIVLDGVGGAYNIKAGSNVDFEGQTNTVISGAFAPTTMTVTTPANGTIYVGAASGATAEIYANNLTFSNAALGVVNGTIATNTNIENPAGSGNLTFSNSAGNIALSGTGHINNSGTFTMTASGNVSLPVTTAPAINSGTNPNGWVFNAGGLLTLPWNSLTVLADPVNGNGGTVTLTYGGFSYPLSATNPFVITANGGSGTTENGGIVNITTNNSFLQTIGSAATNFEITANSGTLSTATGGGVTFKSGAGLVVNPGSLSNTGVGVGGSLNFTAATNLAVLGSLNETPTGGSATNYGAITLNTPNGTTGFTIGVTPVNGVEGDLTGNITITNPLGITVAPNTFVDGNAIVLTANTITNNGLIMGTLVNSSQISSTVTFNTPALNNATGVAGGLPYNGEIGAAVGTNGTSLISVNSTGALAITGLGKWDSTYGYSFLAATSLNMGELFQSTEPQAIPTFTTLAIQAGTSLGIATDSLTSVNAPASQINITANNVVYQGQSTNAFTLTTPGSTTGGILINLTGTATQTIGAAAGNYVLSAGAGQISFVTAGGLVVNPTSLSNPNGNLTLNAGTNLAVLSSITQGTGNVTLTSTGNNGANQFIVGTTTPQNGINGIIQGGVITINQTAGITVNNTATISGTTIALNGGGSVTNYSPLTATTEISFTGNVVTNNATLSSASIFLDGGASVTNNSTLTATTEVGFTGTLVTNNAAVSAPGSISFSNAGNLTIAGTGTYGTTGEYSITGANVNLGSLFATSMSNPFNQLSIDATGALNLASTNTLQTTGGTGTSIAILANTISYLHQSTTPLTLNASSTGGGGSVSFSLTGTAPLTVGGGAGQLTVETSETASGGTGVGSVSISNGGALTVNPNFLLVNVPGDKTASTNISLTSGGGANLLVTTGTPATGWSPTLLGPTGNLVITTNTPNLFVVGSYPVIYSGINTSVPITGGSITITNNGGGILLAGTDILQAQANGGSVGLTAVGQIFSSSAVESIVAPTISLTSTSSSIGSATNSLIVNTPANATASSLTMSAHTGIYITDNSPGFLTSGINTLTLAATSPIVNFADNNVNAPLINITAGLPNSTTVSISAPGGVGGSAKGITTGGTIGNQAGVVTLNVGSGTITENPTFGTNSYTPLYIEGTTVNLTANDVVSTNTVNPYLQTIETAYSYNGTMLNGHQVVNNSYFPTDLTAGTNLNFNYQANGAVAINGTQTSTGTYNLVSWGQIYVDAPVTSSGTGGVTLQTVSGGFITSLNGNSISTTNTSGILTLTSDYGNFVTQNVNATQLSVTTTGIVSLTNANTGLEFFDVSSSPISFSLIGTGTMVLESNISTTNGNILLEDTNTSTGQIVIDPNLNLHAFSTQAGLGVVDISIGALPTGVVQGTVPANVALHETGGGLVYFGSNVHPNQTIATNAPTNNLYSTGIYMVFNSDNRANAISLEGGDTITSDPPLGASPSTLAVTPTSTLAVMATPTLAASATGLSLAPASSSLNIQPLSASALMLNSPINAGTTGNLGSSSTTAPVVPAVYTAVQTSGTSQVLPGPGAASFANSSNANAISSNLNSGISFGLAALSDTNGLDGATSPLNQSSLLGTSEFSTQSTLSLPGLGQLSLPLAPASAAAVSETNSSTTSTRMPLSGVVAQKHRVHAPVDKTTERRRLESGVLILGAEHPTSIDSPFGNVHVAAKSLVVLVATEKCLSVYNFHDDAKNSVVVTANGKEIDVFPGRHVTVSDAKMASFEQVNPGLFIPHRGMRSYEAGSFKIYASEFHIPAAIQGITQLKAMLTSPDHDKQKLAGKVFKTVAVLQVLSGSHDNFELMTPKPLTAYSN